LDFFAKYFSKALGQFPGIFWQYFSKALGQFPGIFWQYFSKALGHFLRNISTISRKNIAIISLKL